MADALEALWADDLAAQAGTIAAHLIEAGSAGDPVRLFRHLVLAGQRSLVSAASEDAVHHLRRAESLGEHGTAGERAEMLFHLAIAERATGSLHGAVDAWGRAIEIYERLGDIAVIATVCTRAAWDLVGGGQMMPAFEVAQRGLAALGDRPSAERGRLLVVAGFCIAAVGRYDEGMGHITEALDLGERLDDTFSPAMP